MIGTRLGNRYEIVGELGRGGMGVVYRARDPLLNREVAVKLVPPMLLTKQSEERFSREAQTVAQMDHPAIVPIFDIGQHDGSMYFLMPVVRGTNLRGFVTEKPRSLGDIIDIAVQTAEGLEYSHTRGVIHRDIKPENIMVSEEEDALRVRIMDFGLAKASSDQRLTRTGTLVGTVAYFSPEQVASGTIDHRSDIYALGIVLYEALNGEPPFTGEVQSILYRVVHEIPRALNTVGEELDALIQKAIAKDPARRYQSAGEMAEALRRYRAGMQESERGKSIILSTLLTAQIHRPAAATFIGREKEVAELQRRLSAALDGECQFAVIAGEPGIGKTRLVGEIENLARARKIRVLHGRFSEQDRTFAYQGFCEVVQEFFRSRESSSSSGEHPDFSDLALDLITLFPVLSEISDLRSAASSDASGASPEGRKVDDRTYVFEILARTIGRMAGGKPLVLIFENLHSAELSLDALQYVVRRLGPTASLIVGTFRQTEIDRRHPLMKLIDGFSGDPRFSAMTLGPFSPSEHRKFIETIVGSSELAAGLAERLYEATDANPFFTRELVRSLIDSGGIARADSGQWTLSGEMAIASDALPATIQQTVERRIERLSEELREILSVASVVGRSFEFRELESLVEGKSDLDDLVDRLIYEGLIEEERESRGDRLTFSSGIVRDVLYGALSRRKRKSLHRRYAELLEKRNSGRLDRVYPQLVHHFSEGDVPEKTVEYGLALAKRSLDSFSSEEAAQTLRAVLEFLEDDEWTPPAGTEAQARSLLAKALRQLGQLDGALREAETAVRLFAEERQRDRAADAMLMAAETAWQGRRIEEARRWIDQGIEAARDAGLLETLEGLLSRGATVANLRGEYGRAKEYLDEIEVIRPRKASEAEVDSVPAGGRMVVALSNPAPAKEPGQIALVEETETLALVFERLVTTDDQGHLIGALCEEWDVQEGGFSLRLKLRPGISFHDGSPFTANDVKASFEHSVSHYSRERAAFSAIDGFAEFRDGKSDGIAGLVVHSEHELEIRLREPLSIYPALLTDLATGIARVSSDGTVVGTGPFRVVEHTADRIVMERNRDYRVQGRPRLDALEFRVFRNASSIAAALRSGEIDLARDLVPQDFEELLRDPRFRAGLREAAKKITYFAAFNHSSAMGGNEAVRRAMCGVIPVTDLVWRTLGRLAQPATSIIPPGLIGHDPGRRRALLTRDQAIALLNGAGVARPTIIRAAMHPLYRDRYRALTDELFEIWKEIDVQVEVTTPDMETFMASYEDSASTDVRIMRWSADYDDGDDFAYGLFHSHNGRLSRFLSSPEIDAIVEEGRAEKRPAARELVYRRFESAIAEKGSVLPLFHEIDYRLASPFIRGLKLRSTPPFVNYTDAGKAAAGSAARVRAAGGVLTIPVGGDLRHLDPTMSTTVESAEITPTIFESLTRFTESARVVPWLATSVESEEGARRFRVRLREDVRFHDGRRLTARDVRYTFERLLTMPESGPSAHYLYAPIKGAVALIQGKATELAGVHIVSTHEIVFELERPLSFFPTLLTHTTCSIVPEGLPLQPRSWKDFVGTGPFRIVNFEPGAQLQVERNPLYWREGLPKSEGLIFRFNIPSEQIREEFRAGRLSVASELAPPDVEALRRDPLFVGGYRELPRLSTYYAALNRHRGPLVDPDLRRRLLADIDMSAIVRTNLGKLGIPARGIIPPGLLGSMHGTPPQPPSGSGAKRSTGELLELSAAVHPVYFDQYAGFGKELIQLFEDRGVRIKVISKTMDEWLQHQRTLDADLLIGRWYGDYPDADTFTSGIVHTQIGVVGKFVGSPAIDHLIESAQEETDPAVRHTIYQEIEQILARDALLLPFFHEQICRIARPEVEGLSLNLTFPEVKYEELRLRG